MKRRPDAMKDPDAPFFLAINHKRKPENPVWHQKSAMGKNETGKFLSKAAKNSGIEGNITNHSVSRTCISRLMDANIPSNYVAQLSGHKNLKSLDSYKTASRIHQRKMSNVLSRSSTSHLQNNGTVRAENQAITSSQCNVSNRVMNYHANSAVTAQVSVLFSEASTEKINGCTFNIQYVTSDGNNHYNNPASIKRQGILISDYSDSD